MPPILPKTLVGERLSLRPLALADAPRLSVLSSDPAVARTTRSLPLPNPVIAVEGWILILQARAPLNVEQAFAIDLAGEGAVGIISVRGAPNETRELGYWLGQPYWGRGLATEAARLVTAAADGPLTASHHVDNPASGRVLEKAGFVYTGATGESFALARGARVATRYLRREAQALAA